MENTRYILSTTIMIFLQHLVVLLCASATTFAAPVDNDLPPELADCVQRLTPIATSTRPVFSVSAFDIKQRENAGQPTDAEIAIEYAGTEVPILETPEDVHRYCIQQFVWKTDMVRWEDYNITSKDMDFVNGLLSSVMKTKGRKHSRQKRQSGRPGGLFPPTGFRIRREYRRISDGERNAFHGALRLLKANGEYDTFANLHQGIVTTSAHQGPNFLGWHRVYLALMEEAIRRIDRRLSIPYWDSTLDFDMDNPVNTILFSPAFFGNGDGVVTTGPFANWATPVGPLTRNIGAGSQLITKEVIRAIMTRCRTREITVPTALDQFNLETFHGGPHIWVGGQLAGLNTAAHDPVFFLHHAFIDYIWEMFRIHQFFDCGVNPSTDYPEAMGQHAAMRPMDGLPGYINIDGYRSYWTRYWFRYERAPMCSSFRPFCGSPYLRCNMARGVCVSVERMLAPDEGAPGAVGAMAFSPAATASSPRAARARAQAAMIDVGPLFVAPPSEPRTQMGQASLVAGMTPGMAGRMKRAIPEQSMASTTIAYAKSKEGNRAQALEIGPLFLAPESDGRTSDVLGRNIASGIFTGQNVDSVTPDVFSGHAFPVAQPMSLLPVPVSDTLDSYMQYPNSYTTNVSTSDWLFVPVPVTYAVAGADSFAKTPSMKCVPTDASSAHIKVSAQGLNYLGEYTDYAIVDTSKSLPSAHAIVAIRAPEIGPSIAMVTASHGCGLMCKPMCYTTETGTPQYKQCSGIMWITPKEAAAYVRSYDAAAESIGRGTKFPILFQCHKENQTPWQRA